MGNIKSLYITVGTVSKSYTYYVARTMSKNAGEQMTWTAIKTFCNQLKLQSSGNAISADNCYRLTTLSLAAAPSHPI